MPREGKRLKIWEVSVGREFFRSETRRYLVKPDETHPARSEGDRSFEPEDMSQTVDQRPRLLDQGRIGF